VPNPTKYTVHLRSSQGHPKQDLLISHPAKRKIVKAGRRGGKTTGIATLTCKKFLEDKRIIYGVPTVDQLERYWRECCLAFSDLIQAGVIRKDETEHVLEWAHRLGPNDPRIRAVTTWDADNLRGDNADLAILDEFSLMNENAWKRVIAPMLIDTGGDAVFLYTPRSLVSTRRENVISKANDPGYASSLFKKALAEMDAATKTGVPARWLALQWTSHDNPWLSQEGLDEVAFDVVGADYLREIMAEDATEEDIVFDDEWLRFYRYKPSNPNLPINDPTNYLLIEHDPKTDAKGTPLYTPDDLLTGYLDLRVIVDPNHAGKQGRCKHAITVVGFDAESSRFYLLEEWAESCGYRDFGEKIFQMCSPAKWNIGDVWIETVASQVYCKLYFEELNQKSPFKIRFRDLPKDNRANAKDWRIEGLEPYFRNGRFWVHPSHKQFRFEYGGYYRGKHVDVDVLDTLGYCPQLYTMQSKKNMITAMRQRAEVFKGRSVGATGY
jgi:hypothetical protein